MKRSRALSESVAEGTHVIQPATELDMASAPRLGAEVIASLARDERNLVVDLSDVTLVDSAGIGVLLSVDRRVRAAGGELLLANASEHVRHVFAITGVDRTLRFA